jgi:hypothetical protein
MTNEEQQMLQALAERVNRTQVTEKDSDAEQMIAETLGRNPDAMYVLAQTVLVQDYALGQARRQIADLTAKLKQAAPERHGSFLGNLLGRHEAAPPRPVPPPAQAQYQQAPLYAPAGGYPIPGANVPQSGGFLRSAMQTATGVAAGALAFEGIEGLMHGFGHAAGYGADFGGGYGGGPREEIVNNYYGDARPEGHGFGDAQGREADYTQLSNGAATGDESRMQDASYTMDPQDAANTNAADLSGTDGTDYTSQGDDSMLSDDVGDGSSDSGGDVGGDAF